MKVDTMRRIDRLAGVPLCFLATLLVRLTGLLSGTTRPGPAQKALFIELSEMGSAVLADPAMRKLRRETGSELHFAIFKGNAASLRLLNTVPENNVFTVRDDSLVCLVVDSLRLLKWCRRRGIDTCIDLELFSRYSALLAGLSGAARRVGFHAFHNEGLYRGRMMTRQVAFNPHIHIAKNYVALVNAALAEHEEVPFSKTVVDDEEIRLANAEVSPAAIDAVRASIRDAFPSYGSGHRLLLVNPNASDLLPQRRWMPENFASVIRQILADYQDVVVLITGSESEFADAETLRATVPGERCVNFCGRLSLTELPALYRIACAMLTNDSGPGHFAAVTDLPTFVLFGPETPALYGPIGNTTTIYAGLACSPCVSAWNHRKTPCRDNVCLRTITPRRVLDELRTVLDNPAA